MRAEVTIIGSGFSGSILAWILASQGRSVALVDQARHPRFAIGESSTPIADAILDRLGQKYDIPTLRNLSCWGSWQENYPALACGRKRGFSYLVHQPGEKFHEEALGDRSLLVAASPSDYRSDTHWHRSSVDQFLWRHAVEHGVVDLTGHAVVGIEVSLSGPVKVVCESADPDTRGSSRFEIESDWLIDASGSACVVSRYLPVDKKTEQLRTSTHACFGHFHQVKNWTDIVDPAQRADFENPFSADDAAQHHLIDHGWMWMLRFNQGVTSVGYTTLSHQPLPELESLKSRYPSIKAMLSEAEIVAPAGGWVRTPRLQRWFSSIPHPRCVMLPTAALTLDPLHSTGIAHALAGVDRVAERVLNGSTSESAWEQYESILSGETNLLDKMVHMAYRNVSHFERFTVACMLYFAAAIRCEETYQAGLTPSHLWNAGEEQFTDLVDWVDSVIDHADQRVISEIRRKLEPWNSAGLMDPEVNNRYAYTATK